MAPVTRRASMAGRTAKDRKDSAIKKDRKIRPSPLKSALRDGSNGPRRARQVTFDTDDCDRVKIHLPTTPHPGPKQGRDGPPTPRIDYSKRKERERLLKRTAAVLDARAKAVSILLTPPQSPARKSPERKSPFEEQQTVHREEQSDKLAEDGRSMQAELRIETAGSIQSKKAKSDTEIETASLSSRDMDTVMDNIPTGLEMPASIDDILEDPTAEVKMEEICTAFDLLKAQIQTHCREFYSYNLATDQKFPSYTYLSFKHPELFRYIRYVADGSQYGWDKLLNMGPQRENLAYAIIVRALIAYIFDAELFGASPEHEEQLLEMCRQYLNFDAFVRNAHRAKIITSILMAEEKDCDLDLREKNYRYFMPAVLSLARRLEAMLCLFQQSNVSSIQKAEYSLLKIIETAIKVHLGIRLAGHDGTVYRFEHAPKNTHWDSTTMNCVNQRRMDLTSHHGNDPLVKVACFPAVYATVPSGPTLENFTDPGFVKKWQETADEDGSKPTITTYPIALADVVLEYTPSDREGFMTLPQTMAKEQAAMSDTQFQNLTGINRAAIRRTQRVFQIAKRTVTSTKKILSRAAKPLILAAAIAVPVAMGGYYYHLHNNLQQSLLLPSALLPNLDLDLDLNLNLFNSFLSQQKPTLPVPTFLKKAASATKLTATRWAGPLAETESRARQSMSMSMSMNSRLTQMRASASGGVGTRTSTLTLLARSTGGWGGDARGAGTTPAI